MNTGHARAKSPRRPLHPQDPPLPSLRQARPSRTYPSFVVSAPAPTDKRPGSMSTTPSTRHAAVASSSFAPGPSMSRPNPTTTPSSGPNVLDRVLVESLDVERTLAAMWRDFGLKLSQGFVYDCLRLRIAQLDLSVHLGCTTWFARADSPLGEAVPNNPTDGKACVEGCPDRQRGQAGK